MLSFYLLSLCVTEYLKVFARRLIHETTRLHRIYFPSAMALAAAAGSSQFRRERNRWRAFHNDGTRLQERLPFGLRAQSRDSAPIQSGQVKETVNPSVELRVDARKLRVLDTEVSGDTRAQIQETMLGAQVLDADHFPEIRFQSTGEGPDHCIVHGVLALHGKDHPIAVEVALNDERYRGSATVKQTDFGITPVTVAGGTVKVKNEVKIEFEIAMMK
jgi:hypothetical protein